MADKAFSKKESKIRVLHISEEFSFVDGVNICLAFLAQNLNKKKFELQFCCLRGTGGATSKIIQSRGYKLTALNLSYLCDPKYLFRFFEIIKIIRRFKPHIVHTWDVDGNLLGRIPAIAKKTPVIIAHEVTRWDRRPSLVDIPSNILIRLSNLFLDPFTDMIVCNSRDVRNFRDRKEDNQKFKVIYQPYDSSRFFPLGLVRINSKREINTKSPKIGMVSRLHHQKGHWYLLEAMLVVLHKYPEAKLYLAGVGPEEKNLKKLAKTLNIENSVEFVGELTDGLPSFLASLDLFAHPSLYEGGTPPSSILEAMAVGLPIITTNLPVIAETLTNCKNALLVPPRNSQAVAKAIIYLLKHPGFAQKIAKDGHKMLNHQRFQIKTFIEDVGNLYEELFQKLFAHELVFGKFFHIRLQLRQFL